MQVGLAYLAVILIWSTTPLAIKFSTDSLSFIAAVALRMGLAAGICLGLCLLTAQRLRWDRLALSAYAAANLGVFGAMSCVYLAVTYIPSGLVSVIFGLAPLLSGLLARALLNEPALTRTRLLALAISVGGLALVFQGAIAQQMNPVPGLLASLMAVTLFALSGVLVKRQAQGMAALEHTTGSLLCSLPLFALAWLCLDAQLPTSISTLSWGAVVYLAVLGSVAGFMLYFHVLQKLGPTQVALIPLMTPVLALGLGNWLADEVVAPATIAGGGLILLALALYQLHRSVAHSWRRLWRLSPMP